MYALMILILSVKEAFFQLKLLQLLQQPAVFMSLTPPSGLGTIILFAQLLLAVVAATAVLELPGECFFFSNLSQSPACKKYSVG